jgi:hypothetical protein
MDPKTITALAEARVDHDAAIEKLREFEANFKTTPEYRMFASVVEHTLLTLNLADEEFRTEALSTYGVDHQNKADAYEIKLVKSVTIPDEGAAIRWSISNFTPALALNKKVFETAVKAGSIPVDLAFSLEQPKVYIKSDLSAFVRAVK